MTRLPRAILGLVLAIVLHAPMALAQTAPSIGDAQLVERLRDGGVSVYFRHADTRSGEGSVAVLDGCGGERNLSPAGREQMRTVRDAFRSIGATAGEVLTSPMCRARETALIGFGRAKPIGLLGSLLGESRTGERSRRTLAMFGNPPADGTVRIMAAHQSNARVPLGIALAEGEAVVLAPPTDEGTGPRVLARLMPSDWIRLAELAR